MRDDGRLLALALGTFHAAFLTLAMVLLLFLAVDLGATLDGLNTAVGLAVFGALWATSVYCTYRGMQDAELRPGEEASTGRVLRSGETWGAWNGVLFFWSLLAAGLLAVLLSAADGGADALAGTLVFGVVAFGAGTILSALAGAFFGFVFAVLDVLLLRAARTCVVTPARVQDIGQTDQ